MASASKQDKNSIAEYFLFYTASLFKALTHLGQKLTSRMYNI